MTTQVYLPQTPASALIIHSIWQLDRYPAFQTEQILPKGIVEVIFNLSDETSLLAQVEGKEYTLATCFINGFNTSPIQLRLPKHQVFFGVIFQPLAIKKLFKTPAGAFSNTLMDVSLIGAGIHTLWYQLVEATTFEKRVAVLLTWAERKMPGFLPQEKRINEFLSAPHQHDVSVGALADWLCYSPRHLSRKMIEATGLNTEEVLLYKKYLHALHLMHTTELLLTEIAYQSSFSDQSHFIKTFKLFSHMTPGEYQRSKSAMKGHLYELVR